MKKNLCCLFSPNSQYLQTLMVLIIAAFILLLIPLSAIAFNWIWSPSTTNPGISYISYLISASAGIWACLLFSIIIVWRLKLAPRQAFTLILIMAVITLCGMGIKTIAKNIVQEPRPYVVWFEKNGYISTDQFYALPDKSQFIQNQSLPQQQIPGWLKTYWSSNTGYSFPSGHSYFAAQWVFIIATLLWRKKAYVIIISTTLWGCAVFASRLYLGMHWPLDIVYSCLMALCIIGAISVFWESWLLTPLNKMRSAHTEKLPPAAHSPAAILQTRTEK